MNDNYIMKNIFEQLIKKLGKDKILDKKVLKELRNVL